MDIEDIKNGVKNLWINILQIDDIDDYISFIQLGGDSIKSLKVEIRIYELFNIDISLFEIFKNMSISSLSEIIKEKIDSSDMGSRIGKAPKCDYYPATDPQKSMYVLEQYKLQDNSLIMHYEAKIKGEVDVEKFEELYYTLIRKHKIFRTSFESIEGLIFQRINEDVDGYFEYVETNNAEVANILKGFFQTFNLNEAPLFRMGLLKTESDVHILIMVFHHIIFDGISLDILLDEISRLLNDNMLNDDEIDFVDYAYWEKNSNQNKLVESEIYWKQRLSGIQPQLNLPFDYHKIEGNRFKKGSLEIELSSSLYNTLKNIYINNNLTLNSMFFSAYNILISRYTGQDDIVVSTLSSGRNYAVLNKMIGMFVNTIAIRSKISWDNSFLEFCKNTEKDMMLDFEHGEYSFENILNNVLPNLPKHFYFINIFTCRYAYIFHLDIWIFANLFQYKQIAF